MQGYIGLFKRLYRMAKYGYIGHFKGLYKAAEGSLKNYIRLHRALQKAIQGYIAHFEGPYKALSNCTRLFKGQLKSRRRDSVCST